MDALKYTMDYITGRLFVTLRGEKQQNMHSPCKHVPRCSETATVRDFSELAQRPLTTSKNVTQNHPKTNCPSGQGPVTHWLLSVGSRDAWVLPCSRWRSSGGGPLECPWQGCGRQFPAGMPCHGSGSQSIRFWETPHGFT